MIRPRLLLAAEGSVGATAGTPAHTPAAPATPSSANAPATAAPASAGPGPDFIRLRVAEDLKSGRFQKVMTRFPPEPNGYLHIGHAKAIYTDFTIAQDFGGVCNLRFDDTNPAKEEQEYVDGILFDIRWLGFDWDERLYYASDYFDQLEEWAIVLIKKGLAYVEDLSSDEISKGRGTPTEAGVNSACRSRSVEENLRLFEGMRNREFKEGEHVLRAKIDMAHVNLTMRDPVMYRIKYDDHHRTGSKHCIYPMYDWAHGQSDCIEGISHSLCSLEYDNHRPLYEWYLNAIGLEHKPQQIEFSRLNVTHTMMSKRKLLELVQQKIVDAWDDPRMPTLCGMRRRGYTPESIRNFVNAVGLSRTNGLVELAMLEYYVRQDLNKKARRVMVVTDPVKLVIENFPADQTVMVSVDNNPESKIAGTRQVAFTHEVWVEREDFMEEPSKKWFRLAPGGTVRLKSAYYVTCTGFTKDASGKVTEIRATYEPDSLGGGTKDGRKVKGTIHWVSTAHALDCEIRQYDVLFSLDDLSKMGEDEDYHQHLNPNSLTVLRGKAEAALAEARVGDFYQFLRQGYYTPDSKDFVSVGAATMATLSHSTSWTHGASGAVRPSLVFNRTCTLKDTWGKMAAREE